MNYKIGRYYRDEHGLFKVYAITPSQSTKVRYFNGRRRGIQFLAGTELPIGTKPAK